MTLETAIMGTRLELKANVSLIGLSKEVISSNLTSKTNKLYWYSQFFMLLKRFIKIERNIFTFLFLKNLKYGMDEIAYRLASSCKIQ